MLFWLVTYVEDICKYICNVYVNYIITNFIFDVILFLTVAVGDLMFTVFDMILKIVKSFTTLILHPTDIYNLLLYMNLVIDKYISF